MTGDYLDRQTEAAQVDRLLSKETSVDGAAPVDDPKNHSAFFRVLRRLFCGFWISLLLVLWPSSDWIGLLVLSQALLAAAYLLKSSSAGSVGKSSESGSMSLARGGDHAH